MAITQGAVSEDMQMFSSAVLSYNTVIAYCTVNIIAETRDSATTSRNVGSPTALFG